LDLQIPILLGFIPVELVDCEKVRQHIFLLTCAEVAVVKRKLSVLLLPVIPRWGIIITVIVVGKFLHIQEQELPQLPSKSGVEEAAAPVLVVVLMVFLVVLAHMHTKLLLE
jgi:hypothetical protein